MPAFFSAQPCLDSSLSGGWLCIPAVTASVGSSTTAASTVEMSAQTLAVPSLLHTDTHCTSRLPTLSSLGCAGPPVHPPPPHALSPEQASTSRTCTSTTILSMVVCSCRRSLMYSSRSTVPKRSTAASAARHTQGQGGVCVDRQRKSKAGHCVGGGGERGGKGTRDRPQPSRPLQQCIGWGAVGPPRWWWSVPVGWMQTLSLPACKHLGGPTRTDVCPAGVML